MGDKIGYYNGKPISKMTKKELLECIKWLGKYQSDLEAMLFSKVDISSRGTQDIKIVEIIN